MFLVPVSIIYYFIQVSLFEFIKKIGIDNDICNMLILCVLDNMYLWNQFWKKKMQHEKKKTLKVMHISITFFQMAIIAEI